MRYNIPITVAGFFIGLICLAVLSDVYLTSIWELLRLLLICCVIWFLVPLKHWVKLFKSSRPEISLMLAIGFGPILFASILLINLYPIEEETHTLNINRIELSKETGHHVVVTFEADWANDLQRLTHYDLIDWDQSNNQAKQFLLVQRKGIFGYWTLRETQFIL